MNVTLKKKKASRENGKLGGVKTDAGKAISKMNSMKHGILAQGRTDFDQVSIEEIYQPLAKEFGVATPSRALLVEQLALTTLRLARCARMEAEIIREALDPPIKADFFSDGRLAGETAHERVLSGTPSTIGEEFFERLAKLSERYESRLVGRMLRLLDALKTEA